MLEVTIVITGQKTGEVYHAKSYPDYDFDNNGKMELYETPVYKVLIQTKKNRKQWRALRFMPFWNDPKDPFKKYRTKGWVNSGLSNHISKKAVTYYNPIYGTQNRYSPYSGAIQIRGNFLIHAGPRNLLDKGWGAAGCVEIIGNFNVFKDDIKKFSELNTTNSHDAISALVKARKLFVEVQYAPTPNLKSKFWKEI